MRIKSIIQVKPISFGDNSFVFPVTCQTKFILDKKNRSDKKEHQLIYQQGRTYGMVGDRCRYLTNDELVDLEQRGLIIIR
jgi:hypothetical protein